MKSFLSKKSILGTMAVAAVCMLELAVHKRRSLPYKVIW